LRVLINHDVLAVHRADRAIGFYRWVFGADEPERTANPVQTTGFLGPKKGFHAGAVLGIDVWD
jgi:catechol 2,3-dioxygenase-like lactoylglutathione lyase family enzyme